MPAPRVKYAAAAKPPPRIFRTPLSEKHGKENVIWPQIVSIKETGETIAYVYDRNRSNRTNYREDRRPVSAAGIPQIFLDYDRPDRELDPGTPPEFKQMIEPRFSRLHHFMTYPGLQHPYTAADIDIVWFDGTKWKGLEISGYYKPFTDLKETERLVRYARRRGTWRGPRGPVAMRSMIRAAEDLGIELDMAFLNTEGKDTGIYVEDGNAYWFQLTLEQVELLSTGYIPRNATFGPVANLIKSL